MIRKIVNNIPNTITLMNLLSGVVAILFAFKPAELTAGLPGWQWTAIMIGAAALFDFCDGAAARLLHAKSAIGAELDSLADLVSFGVAPALLILNILQQGGETGWISYLPLFIPLMGALRLARFNVDDSQTTTFRGMPIPANAILLIGMAAAICEGQKMSEGLLIGVILLSGLLMVSNLPMFSLKFSNFSLRDNFIRYLIIIAAIVFVAAMGLPGFAWTIALYILLSIVKIVVKIDRR